MNLVNEQSKPLPKTNIKQQMIVIHLIVLLTYLGLALPYPIFPLLFISSPLTSHLLEYSFIISIYPLGQGLGMVLFGYLSDFYGRKPVLTYTLLGTVLTFIGSGVCIATHHYVTLIIIRFFCGFFEGNVAIALAAINDLHKNLETKTKWFGRINIALTAGFVLGPFLGSLFSNRELCEYFNYSTPFFVASAISLFTCFSVILFFKETYVIEKKKPKLGSIVNILASSTFNLIYFLKKPGINIILINSLLVAMSVDILYQFIPVFLVNHWHANSRTLAIAITILCTGKIVGNGWLIGLFNNLFNSFLNCIIFGIILLFMCIIAMLYVASMNVFLVILLFLGICIALTITNSISAISTYTSRYQQGRVLSVAQSLRMLTGAVVCNMAALSCNISFSIPFFLSITFAILALFSLLKSKRVYLYIHQKNSSYNKTFSDISAKI